MTPRDELNEDAVRMLATPEVFARGRDYFRQGMVLELMERGNQLHAEVQGSGDEPYHVTLTSEEGRVARWECTCPYEWGGACKHVVAALLAYFHEPDRVTTGPDLELLLAPLDRDRLLAILLELAARNPGLAELIEARALALQGDGSLPADETQSVPSLPTPDADVLKKELQAIVRPRRRGRYYDDWQPDTIVDELGEMAARARPYLDAGDGGSALTILEVVAEGLAEHLDELLYDEGDDLSFLCSRLGKLLTEAVLTVELSPKERQAWAERIAGWGRRFGDYGMDEPFEPARHAALQGWDYPPLRRALAGEITEQGAWDGEAPDCADELAEVRLKLLERQKRWQEYLHLAEAEGRTERYATMLVRLGRIEEAAQYGLTSLDTRGEALALARALDTAGASERALQVAESALAAIDAGAYPTGELARWTRDLAARLGQTERSLATALVAMREGHTLADYLAVQSVAGERWPELRDALLLQVRSRVSHYPSDEIDIFLHEGLIEDAMAAVDASPRHELVERVVEAALPSHPDWVFHACTHQFDRIADAGKSQDYHEAAEWLEKAGKALKAAGREAEWRTYLDEVLVRHRRKYSLRPLLERLR